MFDFHPHLHLSVDISNGFNKIIRPITKILSIGSKAKFAQIRRMLNSAAVETDCVFCDVDNQCLKFEWGKHEGDECFRALIEIHALLFETLNNTLELITVDFDTLYRYNCEIKNALNAGLDEMEESNIIYSYAKQLNAEYQAQRLGVNIDMLTKLKTMPDMQSSLSIWRLLIDRDVALKKNVDDIWHLCGFTGKCKKDIKRMVRYRSAFSPYAFEFFEALIKDEYNPHF